MMKNIERKIEIYSKRFFSKVSCSYQNVNLNVYSSTLPSPEIQVYLKEILNAVTKNVKYADFTS